MKPAVEIYDRIPPKPTGRFMNMPGCYCSSCGRVFALYFYSAFPPENYDENDKPCYESCFWCKELENEG